ncbi:hypothetical protein Egran_00265 [Elaphomyces granulatus]|uniref:Zinc finger PHD-type domain-containing protein n=1 Tax=Elaphomyces granulatus TaxID=519963 RepID=A0A232M6I8_9EURO|nr:hypothetical protein Egran_00265 [Elaphomyces granulatus]
MTPRRSSRARTQPSPAVLQHTNSSSSSTSLTRGERSTRSNHKIPSPHRSATQRSQSLDDPDAASKIEVPHTRQRQRARDDGNGDSPRIAGDEEEDEDGEEEEITRCICGQQDYPGLPPSRRLDKSVIKDDPGVNTSTDTSDLVPDEVGSMFIQCDSCKVWQHGGCVGIMDEAMSPDEYFCEECRKDLHRITNESNGQSSSQYLPVATVSTPASSSRASSRDNSRRSRDSKSHQNDGVTNPKRRSTMNSRDAAYDEEELLRRAIEESKEDTKSGHDDPTATRRPKRSRSDSETNRQTAKRQRTRSPSPSSLSKQSNSISQPASDDDSKGKAAFNGGSKKPRGVSARGQREKEPKEPKETEEADAETVSRRKSRSDRRRGDVDSEREGTSPAKAAEPEPSEHPAPGTPVHIAESITSRHSTRKTGRPPARRGGRLGRNQYTRDRDTLNGNGSETNHSPNPPNPGQSRDAGAGRDSPNGSGLSVPNGVHVNGGESGKPSKPRYLNPSRTSMNEMKRRVAAILEFISRMQVEMAVSGETTSTPPNGNAAARAALMRGIEAQLGTLIQTRSSEGGRISTSSDSSISATDGECSAEGLFKEKDFKDLSSVEMMDVLTRHLLKWQLEYGKYGEKS